jgi:hypothetical protein
VSRNVHEAALQKASDKMNMSMLQIKNISQGTPKGRVEFVIKRGKAQGTGGYGSGIYTRCLMPIISHKLLENGDSCDRYPQPLKLTLKTAKQLNPKSNRTGKIYIKSKKNEVHHTFQAILAFILLICLSMTCVSAYNNHPPSEQLQVMTLGPSSLGRR